MFWTKFIHVLVGVTFFGAFIASFFYVCLGDPKKSLELHNFTIEKARQIDYWVFIPMMSVMMLTGLLLVHMKSYTYATPWIVVAYTALSLVFLLVIKNAMSKTNKKIFVPLNYFVIFILAVIVHDAVMKHTVLEYFLR